MAIDPGQGGVVCDIHFGASRFQELNRILSEAPPVLVSLYWQRSVDLWTMTVGVEDNQQMSSSERP